MGNLILRWKQLGPFFPKSEHFFRFQKSAEELRLHMQGLHRVRNMSQYASIMPEYASTCRNVPQYA